MPKGKTMGQIQAEKEEEKPSPPTPAPAPPPKRMKVGSLAYRQAVEGRVPMTPEIIEKQIQYIYQQAPIVEGKPKEIRVHAKHYVPPTVYYREPTPKQAEEIIGLVRQLPEEKQLKYVTEPIPKEEPKQPTKGIAETIIEGYEGAREAVSQFWAGVMGWSEEERLKYKEGKMIRRYSPTGEFAVKSPLYAAGAIAEVEAPIYTGERLVSTYITHHEPITPRPPYAPSTAIVQTVISPVTGGPTTQYLEQWGEYPPEYIVGGLAGDLLVGLATGKAMGWGMGKAWTGAKWVGGKVKAVPYGRYGGKVADFIVSRAPSPFPEMGAVIRYDLPQAVKGSLFWEMGSELREAFPQAVKGSIFYEIAAETYPYLQEAKYLLKNVYGVQLAQAVKTYPKQALQSSIFWEMGTEVRQALPHAVRGSIFWEMGAETLPYILETKHVLKGVYGALQRELPKTVRGSIFWELGSEWYGLGKEAKMLLKNVIAPQVWGEIKGSVGEVWRGSIFYEMGRDVYATAKPYYIYTKSVLYPNIMGTVKGYVSPILHTSPFYEMGKELTRFPSVVKSSIFGEMGTEVYGLWKELKYGLKLRAAKPYWWKEGFPHLVAPTKGLRITFGVEDLPYRGLMGPSAAKFGVAEHVTRGGSVLLTQPVAKEAVKETAKSTLAKTILGVGVKGAAQQILHPFVWKGEQFPSPYEMKKTWAEAVKPKVKQYPTLETILELSPYPAKKQKRKQEISPVFEPSPMLKEFLSQPSAHRLESLLGVSQIQGVAQAQKQRIRQIQRQSVAQYVLPPRLRLKGKKKKKRKRGAKSEWERYGYLYPVATESQAADWVFGKRKK